MPYRINHIHLKSPDPLKTAEWYVTAFGFKINSRRGASLRRPIHPLRVAPTAAST